MIERNTVLVLGAGASAPYGFPVGAQLRKSILELNIKSLSRIPNGPSSTILDNRGPAFIEAFRRSQLASIDAFLARRSEFSDMGKHAIASVLLPCENFKKLVDEEPDDHWYRYLIQAMDSPWDEFHKNKLSVITFNYDRSFEHFMVYALMNQHGKEEAEAIRMVANFPIVHVYGSLGSINPSAADFVPYGGGDSIAQYLFRAQSGLRVIPEGRDEGPEFEQARELLAKADALCILGFGFDHTNVQRLGGQAIGAAGSVSSAGTTSLPFAATAYGQTKAERAAAARRISFPPHTPSANHGMHDLKCLATLRETLILGD